MSSDDERWHPSDAGCSCGSGDCTSSDEGGCGCGPGGCRGSKAHSSGAQDANEHTGALPYDPLDPGRTIGDDDLPSDTGNDTVPSDTGNDTVPSDTGNDTDDPSADDGKVAPGTRGTEPGGRETQPGENIDDGPQMPDLGLDWETDDLNDNWETRAEAHLADVEFDTDLGVEISRDAMRVAQGELTKTEFHEKHHESVVDEFGVDERPTRKARKPDRSDQERSERDGSLPGVPGDGPISRRSTLKAAGAALAAGAATGLSGCLGGGDDAGVVSEPTEARLGMAIDMDRCIACLKCVEACKEENNTDRGTHWMHVFRYTDDTFDDEEEDEGYMPRPCMHCSEPSCAYVCPTQARFQRSEDGIVLTDYDTCIGCKYCQVACPYGVNFLGKGEPTEKSSGFHGSQTADGRTVGGPPPAGVMGKCTFCAHRQENAATRGTTACEDDCPVDAIHFGDLSDPESQPREYIREQQDENRFKLLDDLGNEPNIHYIGKQPTKNARPTDGPFTYEDLGMETVGDSGGEES